MEKKAVIYTRVSDPSQIENNSLDSQREICQIYAQKNGYKVVKEFREEGVSAKHVNTRPQLRELLSFCTKKTNKVSAVIVYRFDRFSRNVEEGLVTIGYLSKHQVIVSSATENTDESPQGRAMRNMMMTLGQLDNEMKGERVRDNMIAAFKKGLWPFKTPVGYKRRYNSKEENKGMPPILDPYLAPIIKRMFQKAGTGIYNKVQLAKMMNLEGFGNYYRVKADHKIVDRILSMSFYYGYMYAKKWEEHVWGQHEPLIDESTWQLAYNLLILKRKNHKYQDEESYPLKGALKCAYCEHLVTTSPSRGNGGVVLYYECRNSGCKKLRINASKAHDQFRELLSMIQPSDRVIKLFQHMVFADWDKAIEQTKKQIEAYDAQIELLKVDLKSIRKAVDGEIYTMEQGKGEADKIQRDIAVLSIERSETRIEKYDSEIVREFTDQFLKNLTFLWDNLDLPKRQALLNKIFKGSLVITPERKIRTMELSPSFKLIEALNTSNSENVTPAGVEPAIFWMRTKCPRPLDDGAMISRANHQYFSI